MKQGDEVKNKKIKKSRKERGRGAAKNGKVGWGEGFLPWGCWEKGAFQQGENGLSRGKGGRFSNGVGEGGSTGGRGCWKKLKKWLTKQFRVNGLVRQSICQFN